MSNSLDFSQCMQIYKALVEHAPSCMGKFIASELYKEQVYQFRVLVVNGKHTNNPLGSEVAHRMGVVQRVDEIYDLYGGCGLLKCEPVKIKLKEGAVPYCITTARRIAYPT